LHYGKLNWNEVREVLGFIHFAFHGTDLVLLVKFAEDHIVACYRDHSQVFGQADHGRQQLCE